MNQQKSIILTRLVKESHITLEEAFLLSQTEKEYIYIPNTTTISWPQTYPGWNPNPIIYSITNFSGVEKL